MRRGTQCLPPSTSLDANICICMRARGCVHALRSLAVPDTPASVVSGDCFRRRSAWSACTGGGSLGNMRRNRQTGSRALDGDLRLHKMDGRFALRFVSTALKTHSDIICALQSSKLPFLRLSSETMSSARPSPVSERLLSSSSRLSSRWTRSPNPVLRPS